MQKNRTININIPALTRVEGEGALDLTIDNQQITQLKLRIYEPPRYFEKLLEGRNYYDVPDTVARICGICPVAYQMSACHAIESVFNISITPWIRSMRRLFYCGEWIQSHSLHIHLLAAPDYLGCNSIIEMSSNYADEVRRGLKLQALGNDIIALFGARSVHPVGARVGGFSRAPDKDSAQALLQRITQARQDALELIHWVDNFDLPDDRQDFISVALHNTHEYPFNEGRIISDTGLDIAISKFEQHFKEHQIEHSTALHCLLDGKPYLVGPLARINLNKSLLPLEIHHLMKGLHTQFPSNNMFHSIVARAIEIYYCLLEAESLLQDYKPSDTPTVEFEPAAGLGFGCTEAPRGILWHHYSIDDNGCIKTATIIPPTSQNQARIEEDLFNSLNRFGLEKPQQQLRIHAEKVIRNYDPCISCATHFLRLSIEDNGTIEQEQYSRTQTPQFKQVDISKTAIIGIGTTHQGDDIAWQAIDILKDDNRIMQLVNKGLTLLKLDRPDRLISEQIVYYDHLVLIDAMSPAANIDSHLWLSPDHTQDSHNVLSSHGIELHDALDWIERLDFQPKQIAIAGINELNRNRLIEDIVRCLDLDTSNF